MSSPKSFEEAKQHRIVAKRNLTTAANSLKHAIHYEMPTLLSFVSKLDNAMQVFLDACLAFNYWADKEKQTPDATTVGGKSISEYEAAGDDTYNEAHTLYNDYKAAQQNARAPPQPPTLQVTEGAGASGVYFKKRDLPTFSGLRKDWPEFKMLWRELVEVAITNPLARATELKRSVNGDAKKEIQNISAGSVGSYDLMWAKLCAYYDNVTMACFAALEEVKTLPKVKGDGDYEGLINLVRAVTSVYKQLETLGQLSKISAKEVSQIHFLLPPTVGREWAKHYAQLTTAQQLEPFAHLYLFLLEQEATARIMADSYLSQKGAINTNQSAPHTKKASVHFSSFACFIHQNSQENHDLGECRFFLGLSAKQKRELLKGQGKCLRCMEPRHGDDPCRSNPSCSHCNKPGHVELLCFNKHPELKQSITKGSRAPNEGRKSQGKRPNFSSRSTKAEAKVTQLEEEEEVAAENHLLTEASKKITNKTHPLGLYAILRAKTASGKDANIFFDDGSNVSLISTKAIKTLKARRVKPANIDLSTLNSTEKIKSAIYEVTLITRSGRRETIELYAMAALSGTEIKPLDERALQKIFPQLEAKSLRRPKGEIDILLGSDYLGLHPMQVVASDGQNLCVLLGELGLTVKGSHPLLGGTAGSSELSKLAGCHVEVSVNRAAVKTHPAFDQPHVQLTTLHYGEKMVGQLEPEVKLKSTTPKLEGVVERSPVQCQDNSTQGTPIKGRIHFLTSLPEVPKISLETTQRNSVIQKGYKDTLAWWQNLFREKGKPAIKAAGELPTIRTNAIRATDIVSFIEGEKLGTEVNPKCGSCLCKKCPIPGHTYSFKEQQELQLIKENLTYVAEEGIWVAKYPWKVDPKLLPDNYPAAFATLKSTEKKLSADKGWASTYNDQIIDHLERGVARKLTPQEVYNWKGPVFYLAHMALEQPKSLTTPVRLVFNSSQVYKGVSLNSCLAKGPDAFNNGLLGVLLRMREFSVVMVGDIKKMYNSVHLSIEDQHTHRFLWRNCEDRVPDQYCITRVSLGDRPSGTIAVVAKDLTARMFAHINKEAADILINSTYVDDIVNSVQGVNHAISLAKDIETILAKGGFSLKGWTFGGAGVTDNLRNQVKYEVLGISYDSKEDTLFFPGRINFSPKKRNVFTGPDLKPEDIPSKVPLQLTRRLVLQQVMAVYDPLGILSPFLLKAKILLRETWELKLGWDQPLPEQMRESWTKFFSLLVGASEIHFPRCLTPKEAVGSPELIILSDGSVNAYGCAAYVRWGLKDGNRMCRLILAKCRISPINRVSIPQMELNGAVLSKRIRKVIEKEMRLNFRDVMHLIDSQTVLFQINKLSTRFHVYEGVRIGEIQAATNGDVTCWGWVPAAQNIADWVTKPKNPEDLIPGSPWFDGPPFLYKNKDEWGAIFSPPMKDEEPLPGEKKLKVHKTKVEERSGSLAEESLKRCSRISVAIGAWARVIQAIRMKTFKGLRDQYVSPKMYQSAERFLLIEAQKEFSGREVYKRFKSLLPALKEGLWVVGLRLAQNNPLSPDNEPQVLLPPDHRLTLLLMEDGHRRGHRGRDATLSIFRRRFHTSHGTRLSKRVVNNCYLCKLIKRKNLSQIMGQPPAERLMPAPPFTYTMVDLFGPFNVRGEVQKRTTSKIWGALFVDLTSRAVHIEVMCGYDTQSFLLAFARFAAIRGWPRKMYSDPGTQLKAASKDINEAFDAINEDELRIHGAPRGVEWSFGPADSPWYQGAAESLIASAKRALKISMGTSRLSVPEALTVFTEAANLLNERPIGILPGSDAPINVLTPNSLLLGRSSAINPGFYEANPNLNSRVLLVQQIVDQFWKQWTLTYAPTLLHQRKWVTETRPPAIGDVVLVADANTFRGEYRLARVVGVTPSKDGIVRRASVAYKNYKVGEAIHIYKGAKDTVVERSLQKLSLLIPVENPEETEKQKSV